MPRMTSVDADVITTAINEIATVQPLFRTQEEMERYIAAVNRIAETVAATVPWGESAEG